MPDNVLKGRIVLEAPNVAAVSASVAASVKKLKDSLASVPGSANLASFSISRVGDSFQKLRTPVDAATRSLKAADEAVSKSKNNYQNLGRVIQDLPFGFIGIQNNLTQLIPSVGAMGLAFSLLTAALTFSQTGLSNWTRGLKGTKAEQDAAAESAKAYADAQRSSAESLQKQVVEIESLVKVARGDIGSKAQQIAALEKLNKLIPDNIGVLTQQNITTAAGAKIIRDYTSALEDQAVAELLRGRIAGLRVGKEDKRTELGKQLAEIDNQIDSYKTQIKRVQDLNKLYEKEDPLSKGAQSRAAALLRFETRVKNLQTEANRLTSVYQGAVYTIDKELNTLRDTVDRATAGSVVLELDDPKTKKGKTAEDIKNETISYAKELAQYLDTHTLRSFNFDVDPQELKENIDGVVKKAEDFIAAATDKSRRSEFAFKIDARPDIRLDLTDSGVKETIAKDTPKLADQMRSAIEKMTRQSFKSNPILVQFDAVLQQSYNVQEQARKASADLVNAINGAFEGAAVGLAESVGAAFGGQNIGQSILGVIGDLITQIGKALIKYGIVMTGLQQTLAAGFALPGFAAIGIGAAAIAAGAAIKATRVKGRRRVGGPVTAGDNFIVGEDGPELFRPNTSGTIVKNSALAGATGGGGGAVEIFGEFKIAGDALVAKIAQVVSKQLRLT